MLQTIILLSSLKGRSLASFRFSRDLYPRIALLKAAYAFTDKAYVHLDADDRNYLVTLTAKGGFEGIDQITFQNEMLDQALRHEIYLQTKNIRELLMARAMSSTMIEVPSASDAEAKASIDGSTNHSEEESSILADWFEANADA